MTMATQDKAKATGPLSNGDNTAKVRQRAAFTRGPTRVAIKYEVVDSTGTRIEGAKIRVLGYEKDVVKVANAVMEGNLDGQYAMLAIPTAGKEKSEPTVSAQDEQKVEQALAATAAE